MDVLNDLLLMPPSGWIITFFVSLGMTYIITGSEIGYWVRLLWCSLLRWHPITRYWWAIVRCPPCNSFWTAGFFGLWLSGNIWVALTCAIAQTGIVGVLQAKLGGNGIAVDEDMYELLGIKE